jgi:hypothetical protein
VSLHDLYLKHRDKVEFIVVYIREAHPVDGWWLGGGVAGQWLKATKSKAATDVYDPQTLPERQAVAERCASELGYGIPTYVDDLDDDVSKAYAAMPTRLYLVGRDGRIAYAGGLGPWGFKPDELSDAIDGYLAEEG